VEEINSKKVEYRLLKGGGWSGGNLHPSSARMGA